MLFGPVAGSGAIAAWAAERTRLAAGALLLAAATKPTGAAAGLPILLDRTRPLRERAIVAVAAAAGLVATFATYRVLLGDAGVARRQLDAYGAMLGPPPPLGHVLEAFLFEWLGGDMLAHSWPFAVIGLVAALARPARPLRQLLAATLSIAAAYGAIAYASGSVAFGRFFFLVNVFAVALATIGVFAVAGRLRALRRSLALPVAAAGLLVLAIDLRGSGERPTDLYRAGFDRAAQAAGLLDELAARRAPADRVLVPLWLQPLALRRLGLGDAPERVETFEELATTRPDAPLDAEWVLLLPDVLSTGAAWARRATARGYAPIARRDPPEAVLLRRDPAARCAAAAR